MTVFLASKNIKKLEELSRILKPLNINVIGERDLPNALPEVAETGTTFEENAALKADFAAAATGYPSVADDSGLCVDALGGAPGIYSVRYAGAEATDLQRIEKLLAAISHVPDKERTARFVSAVVITFPDGGKITVRGECEGQIGFSPKGEGGFGYDPIFFVGNKSFAELTPSEKDNISHRGIALRLLYKELEKHLDNTLPLKGNKI